MMINMTYIAFNKALKHILKRLQIFLCILTFLIITQSCRTGCTICDFKPCLPELCHCDSGRRPEVIVTSLPAVKDYNEAYAQDKQEYEEMSAFYAEEDEVILVNEDGCRILEEDCSEDFPMQVSKITPEQLDLYLPLINKYTIAIGDVLELSVLGDEDMIAENVTVAPDGRIYYLFLDGIQAEGRTVEDLSKELETKLKELFLAPAVTIIPQFISSNTFTILGRVRAPGLYPLVQTMSLRQAIGHAGGVISDLEIFGSTLGGLSGVYIQHYSGRNESISNLRDSFLVRGGKRIDVDFEKLISTADSSQDIRVLPGDYIYIATNDDKDVYVLGNVTVPTAVGYKNGMTLMKALSTVGGWHMGGPQGADMNNVLILRGELECPTVIKLDLWEILKGEARDVYLQPGDIVYVHNKKFRFGRELVQLALTSFIYSFINDAGTYTATKIVPFPTLSNTSTSN